jgi:hypothetical protein
MASSARGRAHIVPYLVTGDRNQWMVGKDKTEQGRRKICR